MRSATEVEIGAKNEVEPPSADALLHEGFRWLSLDLGHDLETTFSDLRKKLHSEGTFFDPQDDPNPRLLAEALLPLIRRGERAASQLMSFAGEPKGAQPADLHPAHHAETRIGSHRSRRPWQLGILVAECLNTWGFAKAQRDIDPSLPPMTVGRRQTAFALHCILSTCKHLETPDDALTVEARFVKATGESTDKAVFPNQGPEDSRMTLRNTGHYVQISLSTPSVTLDKASLSALFYPNSHTEQANPVGLGFATAKEILRRQRGSFAVSSQSLPGTRFTLALPLSETADLRESPGTAGIRRRPKRPAKPKTSTPPKTTNQAQVNGSISSEGDPQKDRILVMDDEQSILALLSAALRRLGFDPVTTTHGEQALNEALDAQKDGRPFKLAILDLTIPGGMGGVETADNLNELLPDLILVASSGYAQNPALVDFQSFGFDEVLVKPYRIPDLSKLLDRLLSKS